MYDISHSSEKNQKTMAKQWKIKKVKWLKNKKKNLIIFMTEKENFISL